MHPNTLYSGQSKGKKDPNMKKFFVMILAALLCVSAIACTATASTAKEQIVFATSADYPPFEFIVLDENGQQQYVGIDVSVATAIADDLGKEMVVLNMDFDSLMAALQKGDADYVLAAVENTEERRDAADFSDPYYTDLPPMILVKADQANSYTDLTSFAGKSVGAQTGTTKADIVTNTLEGANLVALTLVTDLVNQLVYDKVDAIVLDGAVALQFAQSNPDLAVADISLGEAYPYCVAVQKGDPKNLLPSINATIAKLIAEDQIAAFSAAADELSDQAIE